MTYKMHQGNKIGLFDDLMRCAKIIIKKDCTQEFLAFVKHTEENRLKWKESKVECTRLKSELDNANTKITKLEKMLSTARISLDQERKHALEAKYETDLLREQVEQIHNIIQSICQDGNRLSNDMKNKFDKFLSLTHSKMRESGNFEASRLNTIDEINSTGSLLSDQEYTRSEDSLDLDVSLPQRGAFKKPRSSSSPIHEHDEVPLKKRKSARIAKKRLENSRGRLILSGPEEEHVVGTFTVEKYPEERIQPSAPLETSSMINNDAYEAVRHYPHETFNPDVFSIDNLFTRPHDFRNKTILKPSEECGVCFKRITFGNKIFYCHDCRVSCHAECQDKVPLPCIAVVDTPRGNSSKTISHYCSKIPPMVPPLIVRCVIEVEERGLNEVGIYNIPGSERDVSSLKDRFLRGKGVCSLSDYEIHAICGTIKSFLRNLSEPLITYALRPEFIQAIEEKNLSDRADALHQCITKLPQANRDTLSFLIIHLQKVSQSPKCKMSKSNLAKEFGPMIVGYSNPEPAINEMDLEKAKQVKVMECFFNTPVEYWKNFLKDNCKENNYTQTATPIASIALRKRNRDKGRKIFSTPPVK